MAKTEAKKKEAKTAGVARAPLGDLHETVKEVRAEIEAERSEPKAPKVPRHTPDGILLNPEDFHVGSDGVLTPKA